MRARNEAGSSSGELCKAMVDGPPTLGHNNDRSGAKIIETQQNKQVEKKSYKKDER